MVHRIVGFVVVLMLATASHANAQRPERNTRPVDPQSQSVPVGMCRVWLSGVRADSQPAATDCASALRNRPPNSRVIFGQQEQGDRRARTRAPAPDTGRPDERRKGRSEKKPKKPDGPGP